MVGHTLQEGQNNITWQRLPVDWIHQYHTNLVWVVQVREGNWNKYSFCTKHHGKETYKNKFLLNAISVWFPLIGPYYTP